MVFQNIVLNINTGEFTEYTTKEELTRILKSLLKKNKPERSRCIFPQYCDAITPYDNGESHWKRTDHIVCVPSDLNNYVKQTYTQLHPDGL